MTIPDLLLNTAIGMVTGLASGAFFATRSPGFPATQHFTYHQQINTTNTYVNNYSSKVSSEVANDASGNFALFVIAIIVATILFAKYRLEILSFGWFLITFCGTSVLTFVVVSIWRDKCVSSWGIWCLICFAIIIYIYWIFARSLSVPTYACYLHSIKIAGIKAIPLSSSWYLPMYQLAGLIALALAMALVFLQSLAVLLQPVAYRNSIAFHVFRFCNRFLRLSDIGWEVLFLFMSFVSISGKIAIWITASNHLKI